MQTAEHVHAFVDTVARNLAKDWLRQRHETIELDEALSELIDEETPIDIRMEEEEEKRARLELALAAAEFLKPKPCEAVRRRLLYKEPYAEIARRLNVTAGTVGSYIHRSTPLIQKMIEKDGAALIPKGREKRKQRLEQERKDGKKASR